MNGTNQTEKYNHLGDTEEVLNYYDGILLSIGEYKSNLVVYRLIDYGRIQESKTIGVTYTLGKKERVNRDKVIDIITSDSQGTILDETKVLGIDKVTFVVSTVKEFYERDIIITVLK